MSSPYALSGGHRATAMPHAAEFIAEQSSSRPAAQPWFLMLYADGQLACTREYWRLESALWMADRALLSGYDRAVVNTYEGLRNAVYDVNRT